MKFSQFGDTQKLEREVNECIDYLNRLIWSDTYQMQYFIVPKLNLILRSDLDISLFLDVTKEYRSNKQLLTRVAALLYIFTIAGILRLRLGRFFLKNFLLKGHDFYPIIIGGNNRLRFIDSSNSNALLIAKNSYSILFTKNAIRAYSSTSFSDLKIIPEIMSINDRVYFEKQIKGLAINRIAFTKTQNTSVNNALNSFFLRQKDLTRDIPFNTFLRYKKFILKYFLIKAGSKTKLDLYKTFVTVCDKAEDDYKMIDISVCPSHGDLNRGNIFLDQNRVMVIDWEYFMYRYAKYDFIIFSNNLRHQSLSDYVKFFNENNHSDFNIIVFLIEDLFFRILNFKDDVIDSQLHVDTLIELIYKNLLTFRPN